MTPDCFQFTFFWLESAISMTWARRDWGVVTCSRIFCRVRFDIFGADKNARLKRRVSYFFWRVTFPLKFSFMQKDNEGSSAHLLPDFNLNLHWVNTGYVRKKWKKKTEAKIRNSHRVAIIVRQNRDPWPGKGTWRSFQVFGEREAMRAKSLIKQFYGFPHQSWTY